MVIPWRPHPHPPPSPRGVCMDLAQGGAIVVSRVDFTLQTIELFISKFLLNISIEVHTIAPFISGHTYLLHLKIN